MTLPVVWDLTAYRGDSWGQTFRLLRDAEPVDLSAATVEAEARYREETPLALEVEVEDATDGRIVLRLPEASLPPNRYRYDVELTEDDTVTTWIHGWLTVTRDVTNELP